MLSLDLSSFFTFMSVLALCVCIVMCFMIYFGIDYKNKNKQFQVIPWRYKATASNSLGSDDNNFNEHNTDEESIAEDDNDVKEELDKLKKSASKMRENLNGRNNTMGSLRKEGTTNEDTGKI